MGLPVLKLLLQVLEGDKNLLEDHEIRVRVTCAQVLQRREQKQQQIKLKNPSSC